ncbi:YciI family protein [Herbiconiux sp. UC225_62]|uniref:YciI family protein n=1 Tax=Herbiconiux sp. UC225_62 TaxID=3350168 RepID=UPI0036D39FAB
MKFMMFVLADGEPDPVPDDSDVDEWVDELAASGKRLMGDILDPSTARGVRVRNGERSVTDGPAAGVTDTIWGFDILEAGDVDEALDIAARHPMARNGRLELRPFPGGTAAAS